MGNCCCVCVEQSNIGVIESFGKYTSLAPAGCNPVCCLLGQRVAGYVSLRVQQLDVTCETKTKDNVFVTIVVSVQYIVRSEDEEAIKLAFYKLSNPRAQITSYVYDVIRSEVPKLELDQTFEQKEYLAIAVKRELSKTMETFGFEITNALITDISPDQRVKDAMNQINAAQRLRVAAADRAEAEKIQIVKQAEAEAESKYLAGTGIARQRKAIIDGLRQSVVAFSGEVNDTSPREVIEMMLMTQYFDTLGGLGHSSKTSTLFVPHGPGAVGSIGSDIRQAMLEASHSKSHSK